MNTDICSDVMTIAISERHSAIVDAADYPALAGLAWYFHLGYARRDSPAGVGTGHPKIYMHRQIMGAIKGLVVDHINGNKLDNRRVNLRVCTNGENCRNHQSIPSGICWIPERKQWCAQVTVNYERFCAGYFTTSAEASAAYRTAAKLLHGKFSHLARENMHVSGD